VNYVNWCGLLKSLESVSAFAARKGQVIKQRERANSGKSRLNFNAKQLVHKDREREREREPKLGMFQIV
jgi:hypothetical protein